MASFVSISGSHLSPSDYSIFLTTDGSLYSPSLPNAAEALASCKGEVPLNTPKAADSLSVSTSMPKSFANSFVLSAPTSLKALMAGIFRDHSKDLRREISPQYSPSHSFTGVPSLYSYSSSFKLCSVDHFNSSIAGP